MSQRPLREDLLRHGADAETLDTLDPADLEQLESLFRAARRQQAQRLQSAVDQALEHVPGLLRRQLLKMFR